VSIRSFISLAALLEKVMARMLFSPLWGTLVDRRNWTNLFVRAWVLPEPADAFRRVKRGKARSESFSSVKGVKATFASSQTFYTRMRALFIFVKKVTNDLRGAASNGIL
jgi:hypothetical protein